MSDEVVHLIPVTWLRVEGVLHVNSSTYFIYSKKNSSTYFELLSYLSTVVESSGNT